ncbi:PSD1 and planctomycete cytochrome C domain-containing protein [Calycomorphotria hydatis]|uniref:Planctomycete cytochrome C n=1 Tax=Calycomorphotria hydatis TaxID=2528027 RepID=A0A517TA19_9PLAN|nr:PSD1 and planctomycete cytochrome C domain-containing protein [Calycomorphotria hydatis]QDT65220.1 Planctomycete cytochrome C [Calycomorphotria hydatis]
MRNSKTQFIAYQGFSPLYCGMIIAFLLFTSGEIALGADDSAEVKLPEKILFNKHIRPIFTSHCTACHGGVKQAGEVSFVYRDSVLPPDGWVIEPGDPESSSLIGRINSDDPDEVMPPPEHGESLSALDIAILTEWVRQGAKWEDHWAFTRPEKQALPIVDEADWCRQGLDYYVRSRLEKEGIQPSPETAPERWLRRVSLDLIGLPPSLEERQSFLNKLKANNESAYTQVVDRLLNSPHFGERWASVWLDQVRYADSKGLGLDGRRNIWKYRDWVISAINSDLPYDEFTKKQIAGDLLPEPTIEDYIATAVHRLTQSNEEGGTDDEEFRIAAVLDRVSTTWQTWQGMTFGCVQCHSHPYEPFQHDEFYRFAAFFNNTSDTDLNEEWPVLQIPLDPNNYEDAGRLDKHISDLRTEIWREEFHLLNDSQAWSPLTNLSAYTNNATKVEVERNGNHDEFHTVGTISRNSDITLEAPLPESLSQLTAIRLTALPLDPQSAVPDSEWGFVMSHISAELLIPGIEEPQALNFERLIIDEPGPFYDPQESLNAKSNRGFSAYSRIHHPRQAALILKEPVLVPDGAQLRVTLKHRVYLLASFALITKRGHLAVSNDQRFLDLNSNQEFIAKRNQLKELQQQRKVLKSTAVPVLRERPEHLGRPMHVFIRGLFLTKGDEVTPGTPASLPPLPDGISHDRLALANWLVSPENPLTARVAVNRVWARLFGTGIVATEEDFGSSGEAPSHPELLDYLAWRFQHELDWSTKKLLKELVLSSTYRQSGKVRPELLERDSENRLLARGPRYRLSAETVRDQALAVSGLLNHNMFGPPVHPPIPDGVWQPFQSSDKWNTPEEGEADRYRRSIYTYVKRSIPYPMFASFDAPSREFCTPRRLRSNTPLQALMTLNDATFAECASALAGRMQEAAATPREQIQHGFLLVTCREPRDEELNQLESLFESTTSDQPTAKLTIVASVLLNLDEFLMK